MLEVVVPHLCILGEGPVWDAGQKSICWIDIIGGHIHEYSPAGHLMKTLSLHQMIGSVAICKNGHFLAALKTGFAFVDRHSGAINPIANPEPLMPGNRFNDGKCDPRGRFWAGTMSHTDEPEKGSLYMLDRDLSYHRKIEHVSISNGLAWSPDHHTFYFIDTPTFTVMAYDYEEKSGDISRRRPVIRIDPTDGSPDGMTIDKEGMLWIAHWDGWQITRWNPDTGKKLLSIPLPVARVTSCFFGGEYLRDLYITSAKIGFSEEELKKQPLAGSLFVIKEMGYQGLPGFEFDPK